MKTCCRCKKLKPLDQFNAKKGTRDGYQGKCRECSSRYAREHYVANKGKYIAKAREAQRRLHATINELKSRTPCADCGRSFHYCAMDFDHLDASTKVGAVATLRKLSNLDKVMAEILKCDLVCAVCHRVRTFTRLNIPV